MFQIYSVVYLQQQPTWAIGYVYVYSSLTSLNTRSRTAPEDPSWAWFEFLQLFEVHPWLHPHFGFINLFHTTITGFQCKMIQLTGNYLFFSFQHPLKFQKTILFLVVLLDCETSESVNFKAVLSADVIANTAQFHLDKWVLNAIPRIKHGKKKQQQQRRYVIHFHGRFLGLEHRSL